MYFIKRILRLLLKYFSLIYSIGLNNKVLYFSDILYTYWLIPQFKSFGESGFIERPIYLKGEKYITIGNNFSSRSRLRLEAWDFYAGENFIPRITIGNNVVINFDCHFGAIHEISIGNNVLFGSRVFITDHYHGKIESEALETIPFRRPLFSKGPVIIEDNVWIGEGVTILPNVKIGRNSIIGANSVVTSSVPENSVVGGIPARVLKQL